ncbi:MAG TPA: AmmeMemoRadiSam system protein B [Vicinamibacteria bacterium]|nr:AmmeMemoRadiSam system protein B [Vicinamibacteria bacterium]
MTRVLAPLRRNLEFHPSPVPDRPGLLIRDPYRYAEGGLILPPQLAPLLSMFDGNSELGDLHAALVRLTGDVRAGEAADRFVGTLSSGGFLENDVFLDLKAERHQAFERAPVRAAVHAGGAYPENVEELRRLLAECLDTSAVPAPEPRLAAIAAPHVSLEGGHQGYRAAYRSLRPDDAKRIFVILGTSHYGEPETFGLTTKPFVTPLGQAETQVRLARFLEDSAGPGVRVEDYCHSVEHSIEFQVVFLQHLFGPEVAILPILCGPFARATREGRPEDDPAVGCFFAALAELARREGERLLFVLGIDLAHMGRRYGDPFTARAEQGAMVEVGRRDQERLARVLAGDATGFWALLQQGGDDLKWCGASPLYTFLRTFPGVRGELLRYQQWNIDDQSVVSFAGLAFRQTGP